MKFKTYSAGWEIPIYKWVDYATIEQYKAFIFYVNADKGAESLYNAEVKLIFETPETMEGPVSKPISANENDEVEPVYFPFKEIPGANYITLNMESGNQGNIVVFAYNPETKNKKTLRTVNRKWNNTYLENLLLEVDKNKYTQLGVTMEKSSESFSFKNARGTVTVKSLTNDELKARDAIVSKFKKTNKYIFFINLIFGLIFIKLIYPAFANKLMKNRFLASTAPVLVLIIFAAIVYILSLTQLIPHHIYYGARTWAIGCIPLVFTLSLPIAVDVKFNKCKKCGYYGKMDFIDYDQTENTTQYTVNDGGNTYDAGHQTDTTFTDYRGCPSCGNVATASTTISTGTGRKTLVKRNGKVYEKDSGNIFITMMARLMNPYTWYLFYKKLTFVK